ncbi:MAG: hypothetical protein FWD23_08365 [Oscillospiraceae bacterium]|nr:hypothetical protein [Oscillospiraceae bacterium]
MKNKRFAFFGLIALIIMAVLTGLIAGCGSKPSENTKETNSSPDAPEHDAAEPADNDASYLPDKDYGGYEFRMVISDAMYDLTLYADIEEETGDTVNDAIYRRNRLTEERYNIKFRQIGVSDYLSLPGTFNKSVVSGSDDFDLCMQISREAWSIALTGAITPVNKLPYLDISRPWYSRDVNSEISINGKLYFAYSDECLNMFEQTIGVLFNKKLVEDLALENIYNLVKTGKWTADKFFALARTAVADLDGNGEMTDTDRYGILSQEDMLYPCFWVSGGIKTISKDKDDLLVFTGGAEKLYTVLDRASQNLFGGEKILFEGWFDKITSYKAQAGQLIARQVSRMQFENNLGLFYVTTIGMIPTLRGMETDFGILPFPKCDESQEKYYSRVVDGWINCVPNTATDLERTSIIMETLAFESRNITVPAYFETALRTKYARDDESQEMLDIIHANRTMDLGDVFYMDAVRNIYQVVLRAKDNSFASAVEKNTDAINKALANANEAALALD